MKKSLFLFLMALSFIQISVSQDQVKWQYNSVVGLHYLNDIKLNEILERNDLPAINAFNVSAGFSLDIAYKRLLFYPEFGIMYNANSKNDYRTEQIGFAGTLGIGYFLLRKNRFNLIASGYVSAIPTDITIAYDKSAIDLNNIDPRINNGIVVLSHIPYNLGISIRGDFLSDKSFPFAISVSYETNINKPEIRTYYANVSNTIEESGSRFSLKLSYPIGNRRL